MVLNKRSIDGSLFHGLAALMIGKLDRYSYNNKNSRDLEGGNRTN